jgi:hypothetical protein
MYSFSMQSVMRSVFIAIVAILGASVVLAERGAAGERKQVEYLQDCRTWRVDWWEREGCSGRTWHRRRVVYAPAEHRRKAVHAPADRATGTATSCPISESFDCDAARLSATGGVTTGSSCRGITQRCFRRKAQGVRVICDSNEIAIASFCEYHSSESGNKVSLVTSGVAGARTGACLWSGVTDGTVIVYCKAIDWLKGDASGDEYRLDMTHQN